MLVYRIEALPSAVTAVQQVPLQWAPYVGVDAWGGGSPVMVSRGVPDPDGKVVFGVVGDQFYDTTTDSGYTGGGTWNESISAATLAAIVGVTVTSSAL